MYGLIYKVTNKNNGKIYIGQTIKNLSSRKNAHKFMSEKGDRRTIFQIALLDYGFDNFTWEQIDTANSREELDENEKYWIAYYKSNNTEYGYNSSDGGVKTIYSEQARKHMSEAHIGQKVTEETRCKISAFMKGHKYNLGRMATEETKKRMSIAQRGKKRTFETRLKMSEAAKNRKHTKDALCKITDKMREIKSTLKEKDVIYIRKEISKGVKNKVLAEMFNVSVQSICDIKHGRCWKDVVWQ